MEDSKLKRWEVTYTKHLKQKRKVHHDGFLELHTSSSKVMLYDDSHNLLECRMMKKDEIVTCGETLVFNAHIVDVGDSDAGGHQNDDRAYLNSQQNARRPNLQQVRAHSGAEDPHLKKINYGEGKTTTIGGAKKTRITLSPSRKIIREFKRRELHKYESPRTCIVKTEPSLTEWQVLYTAQVTKKAKTYHDGFLQVSLRGSLGGQVMLFDATKKLLDRRFLKKDEVIRCGDSITFDAYLVDIGECEREEKPSSNGYSNNSTLVGKSSTTHARKTYANSDSIASGNEWQVQYTTQLTQKAKKYHDGFLHLDIFESQGRQIVLYDSCRNSLEQRFLKKDETISTGESIALDAHLIDIGEPVRRNQPIKNWTKEENSDNIVGSRRERHGRCGNPSSNLFVHKGQERDSKSISISTFWTTSSKDPISKPLRDAGQILSILQKPAAEESFIPGLRSGCCETTDDKNLTASADTKIFLDVLSWKETSISSSGTQLPENTELRKKRQSYSDEETMTYIPRIAIGCDMSASQACSSPDLIKDKVEMVEELPCAEEMNECPSFDLLL